MYVRYDFLFRFCCINKVFVLILHRGLISELLNTYCINFYCVYIYIYWFELTELFVILQCIITQRVINYKTSFKYDLFYIKYVSIINRA